MKMIHPEIESVADVVDAEVFNSVWAPRGWTLLSEHEAYASELLGKPVKDVKDLTTDELRALVAYRGGEYPTAPAKKPEVLATYKGTFSAGFQPVGAATDDDEDHVAVVEAPEVEAPAETESAPSDTSAPGRQEQVR